MEIRSQPIGGSPAEPRRADITRSNRETIDTYRQLLTGQAPQNASHWKFVKRGAVGLALFGLAGWAWKQQNQRPGSVTPADDPDTSRD